MKTFMLPVLALFLLLSVNNAVSQDKDAWVKVDFPDKEVKQIYSTLDHDVFVLTTDHEIYSLGDYIQTETKKIEIDIPGDISALGVGLEYNNTKLLVGTSDGLFVFDYRFMEVDEIFAFRHMQIDAIITARLMIYVFSRDTLFQYSIEEGKWTKCKQPSESERIVKIAVGTSSTACISDSGNFFISDDKYCQTWTKSFEQPDGKPFSNMECDRESGLFVLSSEDNLYIAKDQLEEVAGYDGGNVNCIATMSHGCVIFGTETKSEKPQSKMFDYSNIAVGSSEKGVYGVDPYQKPLMALQDHLGNYHITVLTVSYSTSRIYAATKNNGIYKTYFQFGAVEELDLTPYALKISPNPATSRASISFHNPEYAGIEIAVYDLFGRKVADVHSGNLAEGDYNFSADLSGLASGSYFLRFGAGGRVGSLNLIVE